MNAPTMTENVLTAAIDFSSEMAVAAQVLLALGKNPNEITLWVLRGCERCRNKVSKRRYYFAFGIIAAGALRDRAVVTGAQATIAIGKA
jgi:hypothetical protein